MTNQELIQLEKTNITWGLSIVLGALIFLSLFLPTNRGFAGIPLLAEQNQYYSRICSALHLTAQHVRNIEVLFDSASTEEMRSHYWDALQLAMEQREAILDTHLAVVSWHSAANNIPPTENTCTY